MLQSLLLCLYNLICYYNVGILSCTCMFTASYVCFFCQYPGGPVNCMGKPCRSVIVVSLLLYISLKCQACYLLFFFYLIVVIVCAKFLVVYFCCHTHIHTHTHTHTHTHSLSLSQTHTYTHNKRSPTSSSESDVTGSSKRRWVDLYVGEVVP